MAERFTARVDVMRTTTVPVPAQSMGRGVTQQAREDKVTESFKITVQAPTLEKLTEKVNAHLGLIDTDDFVGGDRG